MKVIVIGGGAAGFFAALNVAEMHPKWEVTILEKGNKLLSKVKVSGGGRCNVTNARTLPSELVSFYPRGNKKLHPVFKRFGTKDMVHWLSERGVETKTEDDLRMFPKSNSSQTILDCFQRLANQYNIRIIQNEGCTGIEPTKAGWLVKTKGSQHSCDAIIVATGSSSASWKVLEHLGLKLSKTVPSLFTFNIKDERLSGLQGISFPEAHVRVTGTKLEESGPLLITHAGLSGPAVLKLSAWGAYELEEKDYAFDILVNFTALHPTEITKHIRDYQTANPKRKVSNYPLFDLPKRFWEQLVKHTGVESDRPFMELSKKQINKLVEELGQGRYQVSGKSTFKEEFVTAGGIELSEINLETFECKRFPNLYLAGELLNIDALTGGFNFQACWSAGWIISKSIGTENKTV